MALSRISTLSLGTADAGCSHLQVYCIDNTEYSFRSEDYPINRLHFQHSAVQIINRSLGLCQQGPWLYGAIHNGKKSSEFIIPPTSDGNSLLKTALSAEEAPEEHKLVQSLRLAALACKQYATAHILACIASPVSLTPESRKQLVHNLAAVDVRLDLLQFCSDEELGQAVVTELEKLIAGLNSSPTVANDQTGSTGASISTSSGGVTPVTAAAAAAAVRPRPSRLIKLQPPDLGLSEWQQQEQLLELLEFPSSGQVGGVDLRVHITFVVEHPICSTVVSLCTVCARGGQGLEFRTPPAKFP